jgi:proteasome accessory factor C
MGEVDRTARIFVRDRIAWLVERDFGPYGEIRPAKKEDGAPGRGMIFETGYASSRQLISWVLRWRRNATVLEPKDLVAEAEERLELLHERHRGDFGVAATVDRPAAEPAGAAARSNGRGESVIRPERFARLVNLAGLLIDAARGERRLEVAEVCEELKVSKEELREDISVLNVVNFGGGTYVLFAEITGGQIEVDADAYGDSFARPARLLPLEAKALVAAIDLFGDHLPQAGLQSARRKIVDALGHDPSEEGLEIARVGDDSEVVRIVNQAIAKRRVLELHYYKENEDQFTKREVEPYRLANGTEGWYVGCYDLGREDIRHFRLDRIKEARVTGRGFEARPAVEEMPGLESWLTEGEVADAKVARVWVSPERARWISEERPIVEELADGAVIVELPYAGTAWLVREILKGAGDLVVLEPGDARATVLQAATE